MVCGVIQHAVLLQGVFFCRTVFSFRRFPKFSQESMQVGETSTSIFWGTKNMMVKVSSTHSALPMVLARNLAAWLVTSPSIWALLLRKPWVSYGPRKW